MRLTIDSGGYPLDADLDALAKIPDPIEALDAAAEYFNDCGYGRAVVRRTRDGFKRWTFATGGWSGCEAVISGLHPMVDALAWQESARGGRYVYEYREVEVA
jgi:hypothetical protein